jgi:hypothetical protein
MDSRKDTDQYSEEDDGDHSFDFILNKSQLDTSIVKRIGLQVIRRTVYIAVQVGDHTVLQSVDIDEFFKNTVVPLKKQIREILAKGQPPKLDIQNSVITYLYNNLRHIVTFQSAIKDRYSKSKDGHEPSDLEILYGLAIENSELLFKDQYRTPYAAVKLNTDEWGEHLQVIRLYSKRFKKYLARLFRKSQGGRIASSETIGAVINDLAATVEFDGPTIPLHLRVAWGNSKNRAKPGVIYYDMSDDSWKVIEISFQGWKLLSGIGSGMPVLFRRHNQTSQVEPDRSYDKDIFIQFIGLTNVKGKSHRLLLQVYIVSLLIPDIAHPILTTYGPKGAAKSYLLKLIKMLIDPSAPVLLTLHKSRDEFIQQANHNYLAFYDNVKFIPYWLSDEICKTVTGIGHTKRALYSDDDDIVYEHKHCVSLNGINVSLTEPDALDRSIFIELEEIEDEARKREEEILARFEIIKPKLLAYLFDIVAKAMQIKLTLKLTRLSRMADFTEWGEAISRALGYQDMLFIEAYNENKNQQNVVAVNENLVASLLVKFWADYKPRRGMEYNGTPDQLYRELVQFAEENDIKITNQQFPAASNILVKKLNAVKSNLKGGYGIIVSIQRDQTNSSRITIHDTTRSAPPLLTNHHYALQILHNQILK